MLVYIDAGHGGMDKGEIGKGGLLEKNITLCISIKEKEEFQKHGHEVIMSRIIDEDIPLISRVETANQKNADVFISNHVNSGKARGVEVIYSINDISSKKLAEKICEYIAGIGIINRGVKTKKGINGDYHLVIRETKMPAVIIKVGFIDNEYDTEFLKNEYFQKKIAEAIVRAVIDVFIPTSNALDGEETESLYDVFFEGVCMATVTLLENAEKILINCVNDGLCSNGDVVNHNTGEIVFQYKLE